MSDNWPELCPQNLTGGAWWSATTSHALRPGLLVRALLPHIDLMPLHLKVMDRTVARQHEQFQAIIEPYSIRSQASNRVLPVAAMPEYEGESYSIHRGKIRPALVLSAPGIEVSSQLRAGSPSWQSAPTVLVAPYYGGDQDGTRSGWKPQLVERIQLLEYPQYFWDHLPIGRVKGSILRLDHLQPVGVHQNAYESTGFIISATALTLIQQQIAWLMSGSPTPAAGGFLDMRDALGELAR